MTTLPKSDIVKARDFEAESIARVVPFLRKLATAIEQGDIVASDVEQALLCEDTYTVGCPISEAQGAGLARKLEGMAEAIIAARAWGPVCQTCKGSQKLINLNGEGLEPAPRDALVTATRKSMGWVVDIGEVAPCHDCVTK